MADQETREVFVFELAGEEYGIDVMKVGEVIKSEKNSVTSVPDSPDFIKGITNVRGQVIPLIDLETRFGLESHDSKFIVLAEIDDATSGILVDDVHEVLRINEKRIKDAPDVLRKKIHHEYVDDVALLEDDRMIIILNLEGGFAEEEKIQVGEMNEEEEEEEEVEEVTEEEVEEKAKEKVED